MNAVCRFLTDREQALYENSCFSVSQGIPGHSHTLYFREISMFLFLPPYNSYIYHPWLIFSGIINIGTVSEFFSFFKRNDINCIKSTLFRALRVFMCHIIVFNKRWCGYICEVLRFNFFKSYIPVTNQLLHYSHNSNRSEKNLKNIIL